MKNDFELSTMTPSAYPFETGIYRPPSEGGSASLLIRFTRNCPWNQCTFCAMYKTKKFQLRSLQEIKSDIDAMAAFAHDLKSISSAQGGDGQICREALLLLFDRHPDLNYPPRAIAWVMSAKQYLSKIISLFRQICG